MSEALTKPLGIPHAVRKQQRVVGAAGVSSEARALLHGNSERTASGASPVTIQASTVGEIPNGFFQIPGTNMVLDNRPEVTLCRHF